MVLRRKAGELVGRQRISRLEEATIRISDSVGIGVSVNRTESLQCGQREQQVGVGVREVIIQSPSTANHHVAITLHVVSCAETRLKVVVVHFDAAICTILEWLQPGEVELGVMQILVKAAGALIDFQPGYHVITQTEIQCQSFVYIPVILEVESILIVRCLICEFSTVLKNVNDRGIQFITQVGELGHDTCCKGSAKGRLMNPVDTGFEMVRTARE